MQKSDIRLLQKQLKEAGLYRGTITGKRDEATDAAVLKALTKRANKLPSGWKEWKGHRKAIGLVQLAAKEKGFDPGPIDGYYGTSTESAADQLRVLVTTGSLPRPFVDLEPIDANPHGFPKESEGSLNQHYGERCDVPTERVRCPWALTMEWGDNDSTSIISIHRQLADSLGSILEGAFDHYGLDGIKRHGLDRYGGSYVCRAMRGGTKPSTHSWAIAIDWNPTTNKLKWRSENATLAHPDLDFWWELWEKEGWISLGRTEDRDWMHVQAARRR